MAFFCLQGELLKDFSGHNAVINTLSVNEDGVCFSGGAHIQHPHRVIEYTILVRVREHSRRWAGISPVLGSLLGLKCVESA